MDHEPWPGCDKEGILLFYLFIYLFIYSSSLKYLFHIVIFNSYLFLFSDEEGMCRHGRLVEERVQYRPTYLNTTLSRISFLLAIFNLLSLFFYSYFFSFSLLIFLFAFFHSPLLFIYILSISLEFIIFDFRYREIIQYEWQTTAILPAYLFEFSIFIIFINNLINQY